MLFLSNIGSFFTAKEKVFNNFKNGLFSITNLVPKLEKESEPELEPETKPNYRQFLLKLRGECLNEIGIEGI